MPQQYFIRKLQTYRPLTDVEKGVLQNYTFSERSFSAGQDMVVEGSSPSYSTLMIEGFAVRYTLLEEGTRQITALHIAGDFCDLHSFLLRQMDHSVGALSDCRIAQLHHDDLADIVERQPGLTRLLWTSTVVDGAMHRQWSVRLARLSATANIAHFLCELFVRLKLVGLTGESGFAVPMNQSELAEVVGLGRSHVNLSLQELRRSNLIAWKGRQIEILDWDGLRSLGQFDPIYLNLSEAQTDRLGV